MKKVAYKEKITDYLPEFMDALRKQLEDDEKRWGDTWKNRSIVGQDERTHEVFNNYWDQYFHGNTPVPYLKIAGNALICWIRTEMQKERERQSEVSATVIENDERKNK